MVVLNTMSPLTICYVFIVWLHIVYTVSFDDYFERFHNYSIYEITAFNTRERSVLYTLHVKLNEVVFINGITNEAALSMDVLVDNGSTDDFEEILNNNDIEFIKVNNEEMVHNLDDIVKSHNENHCIYKEKEPSLTTGFHCYGTLKQWVELRLQKYNTLEKIIIGYTSEKREIFVLKISTGTKKQSVFIMGGEEGRDWLTPAVLLNYADLILERKLSNITNFYDFYIMPLFNPDGYMYSMQMDRVWNKNTRTYKRNMQCATNNTAMGITTDRNWYFKKIAVTPEECDHVFTGPRSLSEEETKATSQFLDNIALNMMAFINLRGFENLITMPYAFDGIYCNNHALLLEILLAVNNAVERKHNVTFNYGVTSTHLYNFSGNVADWVKYQLNTPVVYTVYMKTEPYILPSVEDVNPITDRFKTITKEILLFANTFYGPLFNYQNRLTVDAITSFVYMVNLIVLRLLG